MFALCVYVFGFKDGDSSHISKQYYVIVCDRLELIQSQVHTTAIAAQPYSFQCS